MARTMLHNKDVARNLCGEVVNTACLMVNRVYFRPDTKKTPYELWKGRKSFGKNCIFLLHLNEFNLKDCFENYTVAKIFYAPSNDKKVWKKYIYIHTHTIQYAILILLIHYS